MSRLCDKCDEKAIYEVTVSKPTWGLRRIVREIHLCEKHFKELKL